MMQCNVQSKSSSRPQTSGVCTSTPETIDDSEESERVSQMLQRDSLVRGLGVVELVHRLLKSVHINDPSSAVNTEPPVAGAGAPLDRMPTSHVSLRQMTYDR